VLKVPRDLTGRELCKILGKFGYSIMRQSGSHIRLTSYYMGIEHSITIPDHDPIKIGTLNKILRDLAEYLKIDKESILD
jgi:predicted RNA binding protein YcfA (HicA-like mRNA interferase family)